MGAGVHVSDHPLVQHKLTLLRMRETPTHAFRSLLREIGALLAYEVLRDLPMTWHDIDTPLGPTRAPMVDGKKVVLVPVLRAGAGLLDGVLQVVPLARVGHIGLYRDPQTLEAVEYYFKVPEGMAEREAIVLDPMLATGHSAVAAVDRVKATGARRVRLLCLLAAPEGLGILREAHPDVEVFTAAVDERLDDHSYIVPGLGDAGDRLFGTR